MSDQLTAELLSELSAGVFRYSGGGASLRPEPTPVATHLHPKNRRVVVYDRWFKAVDWRVALSQARWSDHFQGWVAIDRGGRKAKQKRKRRWQRERAKLKKLREMK